MRWVKSNFNRKYFAFSDPPLREEDIPSGTWLCLNCRMTQKPEPNTVHAESSNESSIVDQSKSKSPAVDDVCDDPVSFETRKLRKRSNSHVSGTSGISDKSAKQQTVTPTEASDGNKTKSPFDELIKAAAILNPRQFELPRDMSIFVQFPGGDKSKFVRRGNCIFETFSIKLQLNRPKIGQKKSVAPQKINLMN